MESTLAATRFRWQLCARCRRSTLHAVREAHHICAGCEPAAFERAAVEAGRTEFLR